MALLRKIASDGDAEAQGDGDSEGDAEGDSDDEGDSDGEGDAEAEGDSDGEGDKLNCITQEMAEKLINKYQAITTDLGCWTATLKPDQNGACRLDLRKLKVKPFLHHLALIADNRRAELKKTLGQRGRYYKASHLCHDKKCFNPRHLLVESNSDASKRIACKGKTIVVDAGIRTHPCVHGGDDDKYKCILREEWRQDTAPKDDEGTPTPGVDSMVTDNDADADTFKHNHITQEMAQELVHNYRAITTDLGCWMATLKPDQNGYCRVHLRKLKVRPFLHQLALIADNRLAELKKTLRSTSLDISHLCHNSSCFNPEHLLVESRLQNIRRQTCVGHNVILHRDFEFHPCRHGGIKCLLPVLRLEAGHYVNGSEEQNLPA
ncbi:zinc-binding loop region of homing endonuclease-domain-containing protein [Lipomyces kononenkoae]|uniref:Zinc-binding loop region of homing endonuclease-domain-containing protein n=1 Tax=Lipomyces kononenkoae TaxID=34357 RepID=A0ACC3SZI1_LIPKO